MNRISRFARNAGAWGTLMTATLAGFIVYAMIARPEKSQWEIFVPIALACFGTAFLLRNLLVDHFEWSRRFLNVAVVVVAVGSFAMKKSAPGLSESTGMAVGVSAFIGLYMGCYFWLLSDPRIGRSED